MWPNPVLCTGTYESRLGHLMVFPLRLLGAIVGASLGAEQSENVPSTP
jgi:hypothetical protein